MPQAEMADDTPSDEDLLHAYRAGDEAAFGVFYERHRERLLLYAWRMLRRREEAEEVCAEVFVVVARGREPIVRSARGFLFTIAHRRCLDRLRRRERWSKLRLLLPAREPAAASAPEAVLVLDERRRRLEAAIARLSESHRTAILLYYGEGMSSREVAAAVGCTDQQIRSRLSYARKQLRSDLPDLEEV